MLNARYFYYLRLAVRYTKLAAPGTSIRAFTSRSASNFRWNSAGVGGAMMVAGIGTYVKTKLAFWGFTDPPQADNVRKKIVQALDLVQEEKLKEAEDTLHEALFLAQETQNIEGESYALDVLANLYFEQDKNDEAEAVFVALMKKIMGQGRPKNDPNVIEVSLKLAEIYTRKGLLEEAEQGYNFAISEQRALAQKAEAENTAEFHKNRGPIATPEQADVWGLYGMCLEAYSRFLGAQKRFEESCTYFKEAMEISAKVFGPTHPQSVVMINNYATLSLKAKNYEEAATYFQRAAERALYLPAFMESLPGFYCNLAEALFHQGQFDDSLKAAESALKLSKSCKDELVIEKTKEFVMALQYDINRKKNL